MPVLNNEGLRWLFAALIAPLTAWAWGLHKEKIADEDASKKYKVATSQTNTQLVVTIFPYLADSDPAGVKRDLALALLQQMERDGTLAPELKASMQAVLSSLTAKFEQNTATPAEARTLREYARRQDMPTLNAAARGENGAAAPAPVAKPASLPPRVYIQIFGPRDKDLALKAQQTLEASGALVPHVEDVEQSAAGGKHLPAGYKKLTLIYFNEEDRTRAQSIADELKASGVGDVYVPPAANRSFTVPLGQLELWFPKSE